MSIRGRGPFTVVVQARRAERSRGLTVFVNDGAPVEIERCDVQSVREWATAEEMYEHGVSVQSLRRVFARKWHGDVNAHVFFEGSEYEVVGKPQLMGRSPRTSHHVVTIRWLGKAVAPPAPTTD